jgi:hypothetical protein
MIRPNPFLKIDVAEKLASLLIPTRIAQFGESESLDQPTRDLLLQRPARGAPQTLDSRGKSGGYFLPP